MTVLDIDSSPSNTPDERAVEERADAPAVSYPFHPGRALVASGILTAVLLILALLNAVDAASAIPLPLRTLLVVAGTFVLPGLPIVVALRIPGRSLATVLAVSVSLSVHTLCAQATMVWGWWDPARTQVVILAVAVIACVGAIRTVPPAYRRPPPVAAIGTWNRRRGRFLGALALSTVLFVVAARRVDVLESSHFGVIAQVGPWYLLGLVILAATVVLALRSRRLDTVVLSAATVVVIAYNTMIVAIATGLTSIPTAYVHRGFITTLAQSHVLPPQNDARFSWAGFFSFGAHIQSVTGLDDIGPLMVWAPLVFGIALAFGLYAIAIAITGRARVAWLAVILYQVFNWYQQDYFAPQAVALIGYTAIVGTLLWQFRRAQLPPVTGNRVARLWATARRTPSRVPGFGPGRTLAIGATLLVVITANTITHQMTPMLTVLGLAAFAAAGATRYRTLWLAAGLIFAAWFSYGASDFWLGHLPSLIAEIGQVGNSVDAGVGNRLMGDPLYKQMQYLRMAASGGFAVVAFVGWLLWRGKRTWFIGGMLCAAPFLLVAMQSYGGEMIIRSFLMAAPTLAPFAALAVVTALHHLRRLRRLPATAVVVVLIAVATVLGLLETTNRGLNTAFEASTKGEVVLTDAFMRALPPDSNVMTFSHAPHTIGIRRIVDPTGPRFGYIDSFPCLDNLANCTAEREPNYIYITNQGLNMIALQYGRQHDLVREEIDTILATGDYVTDVHTDSVQILRRINSRPLDLSDEVEAAGLRGPR